MLKTQVTQLISTSKASISKINWYFSFLNLTLQTFFKEMCSKTVREANQLGLHLCNNDHYSEFKLAACLCDTLTFLSCSFWPLI